MNGLTQWVRIVPGRPCRGTAFADCQHPRDDRTLTILATSSAVVCGWCGAAAFFEDRR